MRPLPGDALWEDLVSRVDDPYAAAKYDLLIDWLGEECGFAGRDVLVVGAGSGELAARLALLGARVAASDAEARFVELTRARAREMGAGLESLEMRKLEDYPDAPVADWVIATDVIEHIADDSMAAAQLVALARPGGLVAVTVPAMPSLFGEHDRSLGHFRRYTREELLALFGAVGLEILRCQYFGAGLVPAAWLLSRTLGRRYPRLSASPRGASGLALAPLQRLLKGWLELEKRLTPPFGTSLLMLGRKTR